MNDLDLSRLATRQRTSYGLRACRRRIAKTRTSNRFTQNHSLTAIGRVKDPPADHVGPLPAQPVQARWQSPLLVSRAVGETRRESGFPPQGGVRQRSDAAVHRAYPGTGVRVGAGTKTHGNLCLRAEGLVIGDSFMFRREIARRLPN